MQLEMKWSFLQLSLCSVEISRTLSCVSYTRYSALARVIHDNTQLKILRKAGHDCNNYNRVQPGLHPVMAGFYVTGCRCFFLPFVET